MLLSHCDAHIRSSLCLIALAGALAACGREGARTTGDAAASSDPECRLAGFPCTWDEVAPEVVHRTDELGEVAGLYGLSGVPLDSIAAFLRDQREVASVEVIGTGVRYRLSGGRPAWVYPEDELAHHRGPAAAPPGRAPATSGIKPALGIGARSSAALGAIRHWLGPTPLLAKMPQMARAQGVAAERPGEGKKALILSPFEWEFPGTGFGFARRARLIRDYREAHGGEITYHADLDAYEDNSAVPAHDQRLPDNTLLLSGSVDFEDFLHWDEYNLVILASHGTEHRCDADAPVGGQPMPNDSDPTRPRISEEWCPLIWAGRAKQESYGSYVGVEVISFVQTLYQTHPGLTQPEAEDCARRLAQREEAREAGEEVSSRELETPGGKPCRVEAGERSKRLIALWTPFFQNQYRGGLQNVILFLASCRSGINDVLLNHFAPPGNEHVAVMGFDTTVASGDAFDVVSEMLDLIDEGYHSDELIRRLKAMDRTRHLVGRALDLGDDALPARPAEIIDASAGPTHGRDVVLLVDPETGEELEDGGSVRVDGVAGDGQPDRLRIWPQVIGVASTDPRDEIRLHVAVVGGPGPNASYSAQSRVGASAYRWNGDVELGRDHTDGEIVDLEIRADLPGGGLSRWVYHDVQLVGRGCTVTVTVTGEYSGQWSWSSAKGDFSYTNSLSRNGYLKISHAAGHFQVVHAGPVQPGSASPGVQGIDLYPPHPEGWSAGPGHMSRGATTFQLTEHSADRIVGRFHGPILAVPPTPDGRWYGPVPTATVDVAFDLETHPRRCGFPAVKFELPPGR